MDDTQNQGGQPQGDNQNAGMGGQQAQGEQPKEKCAKCGREAAESKCQGCQMGAEECACEPVPAEAADGAQKPEGDQGQPQGGGMPA